MTLAPAPIPVALVVQQRVAALLAAQAAAGPVALAAGQEQVTPAALATDLATRAAVQMREDARWSHFERSVFPELRESRPAPPVAVAITPGGAVAMSATAVPYDPQAAAMDAFEQQVWPELAAARAGR